MSYFYRFRFFIGVALVEGNGAADHSCHCTRHLTRTPVAQDQTKHMAYFWKDGTKISNSLNRKIAAILPSMPLDGPYFDDGLCQCISDSFWPMKRDEVLASGT